MTTTTRTYICSDEASEGSQTEIIASAAAQALDIYIAGALQDPASYNQGEEGVDNVIAAMAQREDPETGEDETAYRDIIFPH